MTGFFGEMIALLAFGTVMYWILTAGWIFAIFWCVEKENNFMSGFWLILYLLFLNFLVKIDILSNLVHEPVKCLFYVLGYAAVGFLWSFVKWWVYVNKKSFQLREKRMEFIKEKLERNARAGVRDLPLNAASVTLDTPVPESLLEDWNHEKSYGDWVPAVNDNKNKIAIWVTYWPISMIWSILNDFVKKLVRTIVMKFRKIYHAITLRAFKGIEV